MSRPVTATTERLLTQIASVLDTRFRQTLRDFFASQALQGLLADQRYQAADDGRVARAAYSIADALLAARGKNE